jgi:Zn-dependent protease/predicted transcriptional regulator
VNSRGFKLVTLAGVRIIIHPSWLVIFALLVTSLAAFGGGTVRADLSELARWTLAVIVALLFFVSVIIHELAHALVARRLGLPVNEITLFVFGGAAKMEREAPDARTEALVAGAGPLSSGILGLLFLAASLPLRDAEGELLGVISWVCYWLGVGNLLLAGFNLIPGFPMDGGRILRAIAWRWTHDFVRATEIASLVGRAIAYLIIGVGLVISLQGTTNAIINGIWLVVIGWFLNRAAALSYRQVAFERLMAGVKVKDVMETDVSVVNPNLTLDTLMEQHVLHGESGLYPVTQDGNLLGTVDVRQVSRVPRSDWSTTRVTDVMKARDAVPTITEPQPLMDAVTRFDETGLPALPVVDTANPLRLMGMLTRESVFRAVRAKAGVGTEAGAGAGASS